MGRRDKAGFNTPFADLKRQVKAARKAARKAERSAEAQGDGTSGSPASSDSAASPASSTAPASASTADAARAPGAPAQTDASADDDAALFARWVDGARPLPPKAARVGPKRTAPPPVRPAIDDEDAEVLAALSDLVAGEGHFDVSDTDEWVDGVAPGIDRRLLKRLKRGDYSVQAHLDLHGMTREEARAAVDTFVRASRQAGHRCILLVHGRGLGSPGGEPVLKRALVRWLSRGQLGRQVLAFSTARPYDGGAGALYVLLRR